MYPADKDGILDSVGPDQTAPKPSFPILRFFIKMQVFVVLKTSLQFKSQWILDR